MSDRTGIEWADATWNPMGEPGYVQEVTALLERIELLIPQRTVPAPRWISTPDGDLGSEWCTNCGYYKWRNLRHHDRKRREDYHLDGGWRTEEENFCFCAGCGVRLDVSLTAYGVDNALEYYEDCGFSSARSEDAYEIGEMLNYVEWRFEKGGEEEDQRRSRVMAVAQRFLTQEATHG
ncbi:hypothetical protein [Xanthobacter sediminis]